MVEYDRQPPWDEMAEKGVLGSMLLSPQMIVDVVTQLNPEDFYLPAHKTIFAGIRDLFAEDKQVDVLLLRSYLNQKNLEEKVGGASYLHDLIETVPTAANAQYYADIVRHNALLRRLIDAGTRIANLGYNGDDGTSIESILDQAEQEFYHIAETNESEDYQPLNELLWSTYEELSQIAANGGLASGVPTGFTDLDDLTNGLHGGQMIIVAARPGVGKSTLALDFMRSCSLRYGKTSVLFSLEMSKNEVVMRLLSAETEIKLSDMRSGRMDNEQWTKLAGFIEKMDEAPLYIDDSPNLTMMDIRSKARRLKQQHGLDLIVVDYLQLMTSGQRVESRQQEVSDFSRQLKLLAKELDVPLVAISQLNRGPESRTDKRPQVADLRESGSLEQDADMVMLLYRPDSQDTEDPRAGEADIILAKHRGGPIGTIPVAHQLHFSRFANLARG